MIHCKELNKDFETREDMFSFLVENKESIKAQKKAQLKEVECSVMLIPKLVKSEGANKAGQGDSDVLKVVAIINTTNVMDSHRDVHFPGLWKKSIKENKLILHVQEHRSNKFENIISEGEDLKVYTKNYSWVELGYDLEGTTEALVFESTVRKERNEYMFKQYANGWVKNHSVGMYYVKYDIAINNENQPNEFEAWNKYYPDVANKESVDELGYFWYVLEAKVIEGSAVPLGSNAMTPTLTVEPDNSTQQKEEPVNSTPKVDYKFLTKNLKLR